jgi:putative oxidoreductase
MTAVKKDTVYAATVTYFTGYKFTEVKFVVNDEFELKDGPNRRILFSDKDTTTCQAKFNINK